MHIANSLATCSENVISLSDTPQEILISLRSVNTEQSNGNGGFFFNVFVSLNFPLIYVYVVRMVFCEIQSVTKINYVLVLINNLGVIVI